MVHRLSCFLSKGELALTGKAMPNSEFCHSDWQLRREQFISWNFGLPKLKAVKRVVLTVAMRILLA
jgi:hypothetical protein